MTLDDDPQFRRSISLHHVFNLQNSPSNPPSSSRLSRTTAHTPTHGATSTAIEAIFPPIDSSVDREAAAPPTYTVQNDPFRLASKLKSAKDIKEMKANTSRKRQGCGGSLLNSGADVIHLRKLEAFYEKQNQNIERFLTPVEEHVRAAKESNLQNQLKYRIAVYGSFTANIVLSIIQVYGAVSSGSLSLFTTMADAIFDPMSNLTLLLCHKAVSRVDPNRFPAGKARIETAGNICFCFLMTAVSFILIAFSIRELVEGSNDKTSSFHLPSVIAVAVAFTTKFCLFLYCWALRNEYSQVRILWEDHRNDLFINGFGLLTSVGGSKLRWWIDPSGALLLSVLVSTLWLRTAYSEFQLLIGVTADTATQQLITYICMISYLIKLEDCSLSLSLSFPSLLWEALMALANLNDDGDSQ
jgi:divalent metal cation (Fe/Co/Zn/Cd) transporter